MTKRVLLPVDATDPSRWGIAYARARAAAGGRVEVCLLHVTEVIDAWQVLKFRTRAEVAAFQRDRAQAILEDAATAFGDGRVAVRAFHRVGDIVPAILAAAEELGCQEIVVPARHGLRLFSRGIASAVARRSSRVPVVRVGPGGRPLPDQWTANNSSSRATTSPTGAP